MSNLVELVKIVVICGTVLVALFLVLLAMPKSKLRSVVLEIGGWTGAVTSAVAVVSPVDLVPDFIPLAGQIDDLGYIVAAIVLGLIAYGQRRERLSRRLD